MALRSLFLSFLVCATLFSGAAVAQAANGFLAQARAAESKGDIQTAVRLAQAALVQEPARADSYVLLGNLYAKQDQADYARFYYEQALTIDPQNTPAQTGLGKLENNPKASAETVLDKQ